MKTLINAFVYLVGWFNVIAWRLIIAVEFFVLGLLPLSGYLGLTESEDIVVRVAFLISVPVLNMLLAVVYQEIYHHISDEHGVDRNRFFAFVSVSVALNLVLLYATAALFPETVFVGSFLAAFLVSAWMTLSNVLLPTVFNNLKVTWARLRSSDGDRASSQPE